MLYIQSQCEKHDILIFVVKNAYKIKNLYLKIMEWEKFKTNTKIRLSEYKCMADWNSRVETPMKSGRWQIHLYWCEQHYFSCEGN